jgi:NO-binding membrane sensor protein with MHYT domain
MNPATLPTSFDATYVALSFLISAVGAFVALTAAARIGDSRRSISRTNLLAAGLALGGIGIWAMHFMGMLALRIPLGIGYAMGETMASLVITVAGAGYALFTVATNPRSVRHILLGGIVLGLAVCVMHYLGMYGMRFGGHFEWSTGLVAASVAIAWVAATAALAITSIVRNVQARVVAALIMATAVCAMHYTGMAAAGFVCTVPNPLALPRGLGIVASFDLPVLVCIVALGSAFVISVDQFFQRFAVTRPVREVRAGRI